MAFWLGRWTILLRISWNTNFWSKELMLQIGLVNFYFWWIFMFAWIFHWVRHLQPVQFSRSVMSDSLQPPEPQHARPPCPSPAPGVYPNSCPLSQWWHPTISSSVIPFSSCPQSFPASVSFQMPLCIKWQKYWSFSFNISPSYEHPGLISFRMSWLDLLAVQGLSGVFSNTTVQKHQFFSAQLSL